MCDLSDLLYRVMDYNNHHITDLDSEPDIGSRLAFHRELLGWSSGMLTALRPDVNFTPETYFLR
jgi:hypothetical protein